MSHVQRKQRAFDFNRFTLSFLLHCKGILWFHYTWLSHQLLIKS